MPLMFQVAEKIAYAKTIETVAYFNYHSFENNQ